MADFRTLPVVEDLGSEQVKQLIISYNALLEELGTFMDAVVIAAGASAPAATAFVAAVEVNTATVLKQGREPGVPSRPKRAVSV